MDNDFIIYSAADIVAAYANKAEALERTSAYNRALCLWLSNNQLWALPAKWDCFCDWGDFSFRKSDLTPLGFELVRLCHDKWLTKIDKTGKVDMAIWDKALKTAAQQ